MFDDESLLGALQGRQHHDDAKPICPIAHHGQGKQEVRGALRRLSLELEWIEVRALRWWTKRQDLLLSFPYLLLYCILLLQHHLRVYILYVKITHTKRLCLPQARFLYSQQGICFLCTCALNNRDCNFFSYQQMGDTRLWIPSTGTHCTLCDMALDK